MYRVIFTYLSILTLLNASSCQETPTSDILNGLEYRGITQNNADCEIMYNDNGDGKGFLFANPNLDDTCYGFCYFNTPDTSTGTQPNTGEEIGLEDLIPYLDEVEQKNQDIKNSLDTLNTNINSEYVKLNATNENIETSLNNFGTTLETISNGIIDLKNSSTNTGDTGSSEESNTGNDNTDNSLIDVATNFNNDYNPNIDDDLQGFRSEIETTINDSFEDYSNVFGLGGYGSAPAPISFSLLGSTYTIFDIAYLSSYIETIRKIFLITAYIFGVFLVFKGD